MKNMTQSNINTFAKARAHTIIIRSYNEKGSADIQRPTTTPEEYIIETILTGGLTSILAVFSCKADNLQAMIDGIAFACEDIFDLMIPEGNGYDNIYLPIQKFCEMNADDKTNY